MVVHGFYAAIFKILLFHPFDILESFRDHAMLKISSICEFPPQKKYITSSYIYSYGHLLAITGYKWDYTFYKWGYKYL